MDATGAGKVQTRGSAASVARSSTSCGRSTARASTGCPTDGPAILAPNHISFLDSAFLMFSVPRNISFVGKAEYMDSWKTKYLFPALGMIPIDRGGGKKSLVALEAAEEVLNRGELFGIFPEGTRSRDGFLYKGRTGVARLALKVGCPIYPGRRHRHRRRSSRRTPSSPSCARSARSRSAARSRWTATGTAPTTASCCARSPTR